MSIEATLRSTLAAATDVTNRIGGAASPRLHPNIVRQSEPWPGPSLVYRVIANDPATSLSGDFSNLDRKRVQIDSIAQTYADAKNLAASVRAALAAAGAVLVSEIDLYDDETQLHRVATDFYLWSY